MQLYEIGIFNEKLNFSKDERAGCTLFRKNYMKLACKNDLLQGDVEEGAGEIFLFLNERFK